MQPHYVALLALLVASVVGPALAVRLRLPSAVVLIVCGVAMGPAALAWIDADAAEVKLLSELGFLILMFVAGLEIDFDGLRAAGPRMLLLPTLVVLGIVVITAIVGVWLHLSILELLVVSASSVGMPLAVLQEAGQLQRPFGRHVLLTASIGEFVSILGVTGYELFAEEATTMHRLVKVIKVALLFGASAVLIRWARAVVWWWPEPFRRFSHHHDVAEIGVRAGLLIMFAFVVMAASLGVEAILGAFIGGALVAFVLREKGPLELKIAALGHGLFIPIFFIMVGVRFDPRLLTLHAIRDASLFVIVVAAIKILPSLAFAPRGLGMRDRFAAGALLSAPLTLVVAIAAIGRRLGAIDAEREATLVLLALILSVGFPIAFRLIGVTPQAPTDRPAQS